MGIRKLKPQEYIEEFYPGSSITPQTVRNWASKGKLKCERTPTNRLLILVDDAAANENTLQKLVSFLES
jgi:predicted site-specific integrase-resolvase